MKALHVLVLLTLGWTVPRPAAWAQTPGFSKNTPQPGIWTGPMVVAGKARTFGLVLSSNPLGGVVAEVAMPGTPLHHHALRVVQSGDSLRFSDPGAGIRFACEQSGNGQWLIGTWEQLGFSTVLALHRVVPRVSGVPAPTRVMALDKP